MLDGVHVTFIQLKMKLLLLLLKKEPPLSSPRKECPKKNIGITLYPLYNGLMVEDQPLLLMMEVMPLLLYY
jgi:hypothetical protein